MTQIPRPFRNIILPAMILAPLLGLMVGCIYVPWFETRTDNGPNVRAMVGSENSRRAIRPAHISREQIHALLGLPELESADGTAEGYVARTRCAYWVYPLCFAADPANNKAYVVRLIFAKNGQLKSYDWTEADDTLDWIAWTMPKADIKAVSVMNRSEPKLIFRRHHGPMEPLIPLGPTLPPKK